MEDHELIGRVEGLLEELESLAGRRPRATSRSRPSRRCSSSTARASSGSSSASARCRRPALAGDELVEHLLLLHGLHPVSVEERVREALDGVRPYLGSHGGDVELRRGPGRRRARADAGQLRGLPGVGDDAQAGDRGRGAQGRAGRRARRGRRRRRRTGGSPLLQIEVVRPAAPEARLGARRRAAAARRRRARCSSRSRASRSCSCASTTARRTPTARTARRCGRSLEGGRSRAPGSRRRARVPGLRAPLRRAARGALPRRAGPAPRARAAAGRRGRPRAGRRAGGSRAERDGSRLARARAGARPARAPPGPPPRPRSSATCAPPRCARSPAHRRRRRPPAAVRLPGVHDAVRLRGGGRRPPAAAADAPPPARRLRARATRPGTACGSRSTWRSSSTARRPGGCWPSIRARWARRSRCSSSRPGRSSRRPTRCSARWQPDVEALLVSRAREMREHWLVPIDDCYELVGLIRSRWRGFGGGEEVWEAIGRLLRRPADQGGDTMV